MALSFIDFCAGIGGGRLGLELNGFKCNAFSEIDKKAIETYSSFFKTSNELNLGDVTKINPHTLPEFDLLISGFPCQSFSIVGKREGLSNKDKGQIIYYLADILKTKQPKYFILENVKGILHHDNGKTLKIILNILDNANYYTVYKILNSIDFNLPQSRERVYFLGVRKDLDSCNLNLSFSKNREEDITNFLPYNNFIHIEDEDINLKKILNPTEENLFDKNSSSYQTFLKYCENKYNKGRIDLASILKKDYQIIDTRQSDLRLYTDKIPTLRRNRQGILYTFKEELYTLTPLDALKLQGFYKLGDIKESLNKVLNSTSVSPNDILRQCGNAMSVNVIEAIGKIILRLENAQ